MLLDGRAFNNSSCCRSDSPWFFDDWRADYGAGRRSMLCPTCLRPGGARCGSRFVPISLLVVTGVLATALAFGVQTWAQQVIPAANIAVILTLEPVFAWLTAFLVLKEKLKLRRRDGSDTGTAAASSRPRFCPAGGGGTSRTAMACRPLLVAEPGQQSGRIKHSRETCSGLSRSCV